MNAPIALKYVRTTKGFVVFPCLAASHEDVGNAIDWPKLSRGVLIWDLGNMPVCMAQADDGKLTLKDEDTQALRWEWGMQAPVERVLSAADHELAHGMSQCRKVIPMQVGV